jgi:hypothetical protein
MRWAGLLVLFLAGCGTAADRSGMYADLACETAYAVVRLRSQITPTPAPKPSGKCDNCNGTCVIGDGRIKIQCPVCKGACKR